MAESLADMEWPSEAPALCGRHEASVFFGENACAEGCQLLDGWERYTALACEQTPAKRPADATGEAELEAALERYRSKKGSIDFGVRRGAFLIPAACVASEEQIRAQKELEESLRNAAERECPECAELIKAKAKKCKHCGSAIEPAE